MHRARAARRSPDRGVLRTASRVSARRCWRCACTSRRRSTSPTNRSTRWGRAGAHTPGRCAATPGRIDLADAERGRKLRDGVHAVIVGPPNAGKSSLLNALAGSDRAIVTDVAGTTRDTLRETIRLDGLELHRDTAGLREAAMIEREGMRRARAELARADVALAVVDARDPDAAARRSRRASRAWAASCGSTTRPTCWSTCRRTTTTVYVSAAQGIGLDRLRHVRLRALATGSASDGGDGEFSARARHVEACALHRAAGHASAAADQSTTSNWNWRPKSCGWPRMRSVRSPAASARTTCWATSFPRSASANDGCQPTKSVTGIKSVASMRRRTLASGNVEGRAI